MSKQTELFAREQGDLFGEQSPQYKVHKPDERYVRNSLKSLLEKMQSAQSWPWREATVRMHKENNFDYLCNLLSDKEEAEQWRAQINKEILRLDAIDESSRPASSKTA